MLVLYMGDDLERQLGGGEIEAGKGGKLTICVLMKGYHWGHLELHQAGMLRAR